MRRLAAVAVDAEQPLLRAPRRPVRRPVHPVVVADLQLLQRPLRPRELAVVAVVVARLQRQLRMLVVAGAVGLADAAVQRLNPGFPSCPGQLRFTTTTRRTSPSMTRKATVCLPADRVCLPLRTRW